MLLGRDPYLRILSSSSSSVAADAPGELGANLIFVARGCPFSLMDSALRILAGSWVASDTVRLVGGEGGEISPGVFEL